MTRDVRIAGLLYLLLGILAPIRLVYIQSSMVVAGKPEVTAANIVAREGMFRTGLLTDVLTGVLATLVAIALFRAFRDVDRDIASLMVFLGGVLVTGLYFVNVVIDAGTLVLALNPGYLAGFNDQQRIGLVGLFLRLHAYGITVGQILWGAWLVPLAMLILKSRIIPRFIGIWLLLNAAAYMLQSVLGLVSPRLDAMISGFLFPALLGEMVLMLWLVFGPLRRDAAVA